MKLIDWTLAVALIFALFFIWGVVEDRALFKVAEAVCTDCICLKKGPP